MSREDGSHWGVNYLRLLTILSTFIHIMWTIKGGVHMSNANSKKPLVIEQEDGDIELVDKNILGAMVVDNIAESFPGIKHFLTP